MTLNQARHGDLFLERVDGLPADAERAFSGEDDGEVVLAYGEATGHAHRIRSRGVSVWHRGEQRYVLVEQGPVELQHEEHATVVLDPGVYEVVRQREYTDAEAVYVAD